MNKKGQTLIIFVILIPIIITMLAIVVDVGILTNTYQKTVHVVDDSIKEYFVNLDISKIENILKINDIPTDSLKIEEDSGEITVSLDYRISSLFAKIIQINEYEIKVNRVGKKENEEIIISKKE